MGRRRGRSKASDADDREIYICSEVECKQFGIHTYTSGKCGRCGTIKLKQAEWEWWGDYLGTHPAASHLSEWEKVGYGLNGEDDGPTLGRVLSPTLNDTWEVPACLNSCPVAPQAAIYIPDVMFKQWIDLAREFETEWIAYLQGQAIAGKPFTWEVREMTFPRQKADGAHVEIEDGERAPTGTVAAVHSHVGMDVFFSQEDQKHFNWPVELVVNRRGEVKANGLVTLDCGRQHRGDARVMLMGRESYRALANQLKGVLTEDKPVVVSQASSQSVVSTPVTFQHVYMGGKV